MVNFFFDFIDFVIRVFLVLFLRWWLVFKRRVVGLERNLFLVRLFFIGLCGIRECLFCCVFEFLVMSNFLKVYD